MTTEEAIAELDKIAARGGKDPETAHADAENVLLDLAGNEVVAAYNRVVASCRWWAYA